MRGTTIGGVGSPNGGFAMLVNSPLGPEVVGPKLPCSLTRRSLPKGEAGPNMVLFTVVQGTKPMTREIAEAVDISEEQELEMTDLTEATHNEDVSLMAGSCGGHGGPFHAS